MARDAGRKQDNPAGAGELSYEQVMERLESVVKTLEKGDLPLEQSLKAFEEGIQLVRQGEARLNEAEKRVEQLLATPQGDKVAPVQGEGAARQQPESRRQPGRPDARPEPPPPDGDDDVPF